jgi:carbon-monoxide dehydrogenase small subunit
VTEASPLQPHSQRIRLEVNGSAHDLDVEPRRTLADALRDDLGLTGTHLGCEQGVCGACTVLMDGEPVRSCLLLAVQCDGARLRTVEGVARDGGELHPVQQAMIEHQGLQCGFCTPGFVTLLAGALEADPDRSDEELVDLVASNLCRCTGYTGIVAAARQAADVLRKERESTTEGESTASKS